MSPTLIVISIIAAAILGVVADRLLDKSLSRILAGRTTTIPHVVGIGIGVIVLIFLVALPALRDSNSRSSEDELKEMNEQVMLLRLETASLRRTLADLSAEDVNREQLDVLQTGLTQLEEVSTVSTDWDTIAVLQDPSLTNDDKVALIRMLLLEEIDEDEGIQRQFELVQSLDQSSPSIDVETMKLKRMIDKRSQTLDMLRQITDQYNQTARGIIDSIGR